ncbi:BACON domain-containing carbohydrate-binding protein [Termitidicoccus mucosus]|uniref:BACON domain-containing protein n=1 Tax=Termitidicoccus mucosus TaxID=1184151 RepID=A0A178IHW6_9BACT|nr:hypothetical protein AW736_17335 [Opitutaceae bacterium TSB47]
MNKSIRKPIRRKILTFAASVLLATAALLLFRSPAKNTPPSPAAPTADVPAGAAGETAAGQVAAVDAVSAPDPAAPLSPKVRATFEKIPDGRFREEVLALAPAARTRVLRQLAARPVPAADYASLRVTPEGMLYYACVFPAAPTVASGTTPASAITPADDPSLLQSFSPSVFSTPAAAPVPISQPPVRHSRPGSRNILFLDFSGMEIRDTLWNTSAGGTGVRPLIRAKPFSLDSDTTTFSDTEQQAILLIWERVAEDFAPFDVDVTTEKPAEFIRTTGHALVTHSKDNDNRDMPGVAGGAAGIAFLDCFGEINYAEKVVNAFDTLPAASPALIYHDKLSNNSASIAYAVSHELGHNLGLHHDGPGSVIVTGGDGEDVYGYYGGHGSGATSWAPIMGNGYSRSVTQWSKGEYYSANNHEDDLAFIESKLGYREETADTSPALADALVPAADGRLGASGVLLRAGDAHLYSVNLGSAAATSSTLNPFRPADGSTANAGNTDLRLEILDASGIIVAADNPANAANATLTHTLVPGQWLLRVTSTGYGTPLAGQPTGYTDYGSIGQYTLVTNLVPSAPALPDALAASATAPRLLWHTTTASAMPWFGQAGITHDGLHAAQSGSIPAGAASILATILEGPGILGFWWKTSAASGDTLALTLTDLGSDTTSGGASGTLSYGGINTGTLTLSGSGGLGGSGTLVTGSTGGGASGTTSIPFLAASAPQLLAEISGQTNWTYHTATLTTLGAHLLEWTYLKDAATPSVAYLDQVSWAPAQTILAPIPAVRDVTSGTGQFTLAIETNTVWAAATDAPWLALAPASGTGVAILTVTHDANPMSLARRATVAITAGGLVRTTAVTQSFTIPLATALDNALTWQTGGDGDWFGQKTTMHDGAHAARSGLIRGDQQSWLQTTVSGTGLLRFWWKVSSEEEEPDAFDGMRFYIDDQEQARISGEMDWAPREFPLTTPGAHTLKWQYEKDYYLSVGTDAAWLDQVTWQTTPASLAITPSEVDVRATAGQFSIMVTSDVSWNATSGVPWLTVTPASGAGNATLTATYSANSVPAARVATLTVTAVGETRFCEVTQASASGISTVSTGSATGDTNNPGTTPGADSGGGGAASLWSLAALALLFGIRSRRKLE